jgi:hypothetical protein
MSVKLDRLERKIDLLRKQQEDTEDDVEESLDASEDTEKDVGKLERDVDKMERDIDKMEEELINIGRFTVGREHVMELARGAAGAFLGVGIGLGVRWMPGMAENLEWAHAASILFFILLVGALLIWKNEKEWIAKQGNSFIPKRLMHLLIISLVMESIGLTIFNMMPSDPTVIVKTLIVGSYPAMSGAITFTIT